MFRNPRCLIVSAAGDRHGVLPEFTRRTHAVDGQYLEGGAVEVDGVLHLVAHHHGHHVAVVHAHGHQLADLDVERAGVRMRAAVDGPVHHGGIAAVSHVAAAHRRPEFQHDVSPRVCLDRIGPRCRYYERRGDAGNPVFAVDHWNHYPRG